MKSRSTGDAHITMVLVMEMPKTRGCPYYSDVAANFQITRVLLFSTVPWPCFRDVFTITEGWVSTGKEFPAFNLIPVLFVTLNPLTRARTHVPLERFLDYRILTKCVERIYSYAVSVI